MTDEQYEAFEVVFREVGRPLMDRLREALISQGSFTDLEQVAVVDHDTDRGLGFQSESEVEFYVELMLIDGEDYGSNGVALMLRAAPDIRGVVWAPGDGTPDFDLASPEDVAQRLSRDFDVYGLADRITSVWVETANRIKLSERAGV